jgi:2,4-dienoyl-CoA reductase-like NADH-dependent reductase (Old Yellow Enzyme family)
MSKLFEQSEINKMVLLNRFVRSATWEGMAAEDGAATPGLNEEMVKLALGEVGLIITGHAYIRQEGQAGMLQLGMYKDELIPGLQKMTDKVHEAGGKIVAQLAHAGHFAIKQLTGQIPLVVSNFEGLAKSPRKEMTVQDIQELVDVFKEAAVRARTAGFDGVQIHAAHGYLLSQFLSPSFNKRQDEFGGDVHGRAKIHVEILEAIRKAVGDDYPVLIKMNSQDFVENGLSLEDSLQAGRMLADAGLDAIELSGGMLTSGNLSPSRSGINTEEKEAYFREAAKLFKSEIDIPIILVGGMRSFEVADRLVEEGAADYISMCRPLIREPQLIKRWKEGDRRKAECNSDNLCFGPALEGKGIFCVTKELKQKE